MKHIQTIWVLGGDVRQAYLARLLCQDGYHVHTFALEQSAVSCPELIPEIDLSHLEDAQVVILPLPVSTKDGNLFAPLSTQVASLDEIISLVHGKQLLLGGRPNPKVIAAARQHGLTMLDYFSREELAVANCVPTAEGCLQLAMEHMPITIHGSRALILGYGRLGRITAARFAALGSHVTVAARKQEQFAWAEAAGHQTLPIHSLSGSLGEFDLVVNTIPFPVLGEALLQELPSGCLVIDLASDPGGVDYAAAQTLNCRVLHALALPGKCAPASAAAIVQQTLYHIFHERGH